MHLVMIGGSDAGISAALRAREVDPGADVTVVVADAYPNFSICGIPYYLSGEVTPWQSLAHRTIADLEAAGMWLRLNTTARRIDVPGRKLLLTSADGGEEVLGYDKLVVGTGAVPVRPPISGLAGPGALGAATACTCCTRWATPSPSYAPSKTRHRPARLSSAPGTSAWKWPTP